MSERNLARFEDNVQRLRDNHSIAAGQLPGVAKVFKNTVFADNDANLGEQMRLQQQTPKSFDEYKILDDIHEIPSLKKGIMSDDSYSRLELSSLHGNNLDRRLINIIPITDKQAQRTTLDQSMLSGDYEEEIDSWLHVTMTDVPVTTYPLHMSGSIEATEHEAAKHYEQNRQLYLAMALAEAAARGTEINLNSTLDAVNVQRNKEG